MKAVISKQSEKVLGNTLKAYAAAAFGIKNSTADIISQPHSVIKVYKKGQWTTYEWFTTDTDYVFVETW